MSYIRMSDLGHLGQEKAAAAGTTGPDASAMALEATRQAIAAATNIAVARYGGQPTPPPVVALAPPPPSRTGLWVGLGIATALVGGGIWLATRK